MSGITLVFIDPAVDEVRRERRVRAGVEVGAGAGVRQRVERGRRSRAGSSSAAFISSATSERRRPAPRHSSWKRGAGRYSASRCTTPAALTSALSMRNGIEPWPGVPRTRSRRHATPFSPTVTPMRRLPPACRRGARRSRSAGSRSGSRRGGGRRPIARRGRCRPPRRRRRSRAGRRVGRKPRSREVPERDRHRRREVEHVDRAAAPHLVDAVGVR